MKKTKKALAMTLAGVMAVSGVPGYVVSADDQVENPVLPVAPIAEEEPIEAPAPTPEPAPAPEPEPAPAPAATILVPGTVADPADPAAQAGAPGIKLYGTKVDPNSPITYTKSDLDAPNLDAPNHDAQSPSVSTSPLSPTVSSPEPTTTISAIHQSAPVLVADQLEAQLTPFSLLVKGHVVTTASASHYVVAADSIDKLKALDQYEGTMDGLASQGLYTEPIHGVLTEKGSGINDFRFTFKEERLVGLDPNKTYYYGVVESERMSRSTDGAGTGNDTQEEYFINKLANEPLAVTTLEGQALSPEDFCISAVRAFIGAEDEPHVIQFDHTNLTYDFVDELKLEVRALDANGQEQDTYFVVYGTGGLVNAQDTINLYLNQYDSLMEVRLVVKARVSDHQMNFTSEWLNLDKNKQQYKAHLSHTLADNGNIEAVVDWKDAQKAGGDDFKLLVSRYPSFVSANVLGSDLATSTSPVQDVFDLDYLQRGVDYWFKVVGFNATSGTSYDITDSYKVFTPLVADPENAYDYSNLAFDISDRSLGLKGETENYTFSYEDAQVLVATSYEAMADYLNHPGQMNLLVSRVPLFHKLVKDGTATKGVIYTGANATGLKPNTTYVVALVHNGIIDHIREITTSEDSGHTIEAPVFSAELKNLGASTFQFNMQVDRVDGQAFSHVGYIAYDDRGDVVLNEANDPANVPRNYLVQNKYSFEGTYFSDRIKYIKPYVHYIIDGQVKAYFGQPLYLHRQGTHRMTVLGPQPSANAAQITYEIQGSTWHSDGEFELELADNSDFYNSRYIEVDGGDRGTYAFANIVRTEPQMSSGSLFVPTFFARLVNTDVTTTSGNTISSKTYSKVVSFKLAQDKVLNVGHFGGNQILFDAVVARAKEVKVNSWLGTNKGLADPSGKSILQSELDAISHIYLSDLLDLQSLEGIQNLKGLTQLYIDNAPKLTTLAPLNGMKQITGIDISNTGLVNAGAVSSLTSLKYLRLSNSRLRGLPNLSQHSLLKIYTDANKSNDRNYWVDFSGNKLTATDFMDSIFGAQISEDVDFDQWKSDQIASQLKVAELKLVQYNFAKTHLAIRAINLPNGQYPVSIKVGQDLLFQGPVSFKNGTGYIDLAQVPKLKAYNIGTTCYVNLTVDEEVNQAVFTRIATPSETGDLRHVYTNTLAHTYTAYAEQGLLKAVVPIYGASGFAPSKAVDVVVVNAMGQPVTLTAPAKVVVAPLQDRFGSSPVGQVGSGQGQDQGQDQQLQIDLPLGGLAPGHYYLYGQLASGERTATGVALNILPLNQIGTLNADAIYGVRSLPSQGQLGGTTARIYLGVVGTDLKAPLVTFKSKELTKDELKALTIKVLEGGTCIEVGNLPTQKQYVDLEVLYGGKAIKSLNSPLVDYYSQAIYSNLNVPHDVPQPVSPFLYNLVQTPDLALVGIATAPANPDRNQVIPKPASLELSLPYAQGANSVLATLSLDQNGFINQTQLGRLNLDLDLSYQVTVRDAGGQYLFEASEVYLRGLAEGPVAATAVTTNVNAQSNNILVNQSAYIAKNFDVAPFDAKVDQLLYTVDANSSGAGSIDLRGVLSSFEATSPGQVTLVAKSPKTNAQATFSVNVINGKLDLSKVEVISPANEGTLVTDVIERARVVDWGSNAFMAKAETLMGLRVILVKGTPAQQAALDAAGSIEVKDNKIHFTPKPGYMGYIEVPYAIISETQALGNVDDYMHAISGAPKNLVTYSINAPNTAPVLTIKPSIGTPQAPIPAPAMVDVPGSTTGEKAYVVENKGSISFDVTYTDDGLSTPGGSLNFKVPAQPNHGTLDLGTESRDPVTNIISRTLKFTPYETGSGFDALTIMVLDDRGKMVVQKLHLFTKWPTVSGLADTYDMLEDGQEIELDVAANDIGASLATLSLERGLSDPAAGNLALRAGKFYFKPAANYCQDVTFAYRLHPKFMSDADKSLDIVTKVTIKVAPVNDAPVFGTFTLAHSVESGKVLSFATRATDADGAKHIDGTLNALVYSVSSAAAHGVAVIDGTGRVTYSPTAGYTGPDTFTIKVTDKAGATLAGSLATIAVTVTPAAPVVVVPPGPVIVPPGPGPVIVPGTPTTPVTPTTPPAEVKKEEPVVITEPATPLGDLTFGDLASVPWANKAIGALYARGVISGKAAGKFDPNGRINRAEFAVIAARLLKLKLGAGPGAGAGAGPIQFKDVKNGDWFAAEVLAAASSGLLKGSGGRFSPNGLLSRQELATILGRIITANLDKISPDLKNASGLGSLSSYTDAGSIATWATEGALLCLKYGIITGSQGRFAPNEPATRAEAAVMLYRLVELLGL